MVPIFKNVGKRSTAKNYCPVSLLFVVSKVFKKLVNNRIVDHLEKGQLQISSHVSDRIARAFNRSGATRAVSLDISKAFDRFGMLVFFTNVSLMEFQVRYLVLFLLFSASSGSGWKVFTRISSSSRLHSWSYTFPAIH